MTQEVAVELGKRFIQRRDAKAVQHEDGSWMPTRTRAPKGQQGENIGWKMADLISHIEGTHTYGHYLVGTDDKVKLFAFDIDLNKTGWFMDLSSEEGEGGPTPCNPRETWLEKGHPARTFHTIQLRAMADALGGRVRQYGIPCAVAYSGSKGLHVYGWTGEIAAAEARQAAIAVLNSFKNPDGAPGFVAVRGQNFFESNVEGTRNLSIEIYPKQETLEGKDLGNLMRLPLGIHRRSGHPGFFVDMTKPLHQLKPLDPMETLINGHEW